jgi:23S rRNA pseudouridine1911/1915/1917 synthase
MGREEKHQPEEPVDGAPKSGESWDDVVFEANPEEETVALAAGEAVNPELDEEIIELPKPNAFGTEPEHRRISVRKDLLSRVDVYLQNRLKGISRSRVQKLIDMGGVKINGKLPKASTKIRAGDEIDIVLPAKAVKRILAEEIPLDVLFEDEHLIVINKQANLIVHPARSQTSGTLLNGLAWRFKQRVEAAGGTYQELRTRGFAPDKKMSEEDGRVGGLSAVGAQEFRPGIIHRLDKNTTGCIVVAKSDEAHWGVAKQFEERSTLKAYLAVVHGNIDPPGGAFEYPIGQHPTIKEAFSVRHDSVAKYALTYYRVREQYQGYCLVELELKTGRTHQIRVHLSYTGNPIVGDLVYGGEAVGLKELDSPPIAAGSRKLINFARDKEAGQKAEREVAARKDVLIAQPALHAGLLQFTHPITKQVLRFTAPLHEPMASLVRELRKRPSDMPVVTEGYWTDLEKLVR